MTWHPDRPRAGFWMLRVMRTCPFVAARIWLCDHEPGEPENRMDRPYWQGQIGLDLTPPATIWAMLEYCESSPEQQAALINPPEVDRAPRNGRAPALQWAPMAKWKQDRAYRISAAQYEQELAWLSWASRHAPSHPDFLFRKPLDLNIAPIPKWANAIGSIK